MPSRFAVFLGPSTSDGATAAGAAANRRVLEGCGSHGNAGNRARLLHTVGWGDGGTRNSDFFIFLRRLKQHCRRIYSQGNRDMTASTVQSATYIREFVASKRINSSAQKT